MTWRSGRWGVLGVVLAVVGCTDRPTGGGEETSGTTEAATSGTTGTISASGSTSGAATGSTSGAVDSTSSSSSDEGVLDEGPWCSVPGEGQLAHCQPDWGNVPFECDVIAQDCPEGEKCSPWANDGGPAWNATRCVPIHPGPDPVGAPCTVAGSAVSGIDSCALGAHCWNVDPVTLEGVCVATCTGNASNPLCEDPDTACVLANEGAIALCLRACDPLLQDCPDGESCVPEPDEEWFVCMPPGGASAADGDECEYLNVCAMGSVCAIVEAVPGCAGAQGCCTPYCDLSSPLGHDQCAEQGTLCVPWYQRGASPGIQNEGVCSAVTEQPEDGWSRADTVRANLP